ncbi:MAG: glycosyltransferase [Actinomycetota bacterium]
MKVAIVHDYLVNRGGAEKVTLAMHRMWPDAPVFTSLYYPEATFPEFADIDVRTSRLQRLRGDPAEFRRLLPLFGRAMRSLRIEGFDVVVCSSAGFAHHVRPRAGCRIVYCHTPPRFLWDERYDHRAVAPGWSRPALPLALAALRRSDRAAAARAHVYVANSRATAGRIQAIYGRRSVLVHPPVEVNRFAIAPRTGDYYLMVGRLMPHRNMHLAVEAFTTMGRSLVVVGDGPARVSLESIAGPTVRFMGALDDAALVRLYAECRGVVVPGEEDFGIVPLEANAAGRPVVAFSKGGALETVTDGVNGVLFAEESAGAITRAVARADARRFDPVALRSHAEQFSEDVFAHNLRGIVEGAGTCLRCARRRRHRATAATDGNH